MTHVPVGRRPALAGLLVALGLVTLAGIRPATAAALPVPTTTVPTTTVTVPVPLPGVEPLRVPVPAVEVPAVVVPAAPVAPPSAESGTTQRAPAPSNAEPPAPSRPSESPRASEAPRPSEPAPPSEPADQPAPLTARRLRETAAESARAFGFPFGLALLVALFLAVQHRIDRRDPRLASAPVDDDLRSFG